MTPALRDLTEVLPLALVTDSVRDPWLRLGDATGSLVVVAIIAVLATGLAARRTAL